MSIFNSEEEEEEEQQQQLLNSLNAMLALKIEYM